MLFKQPKYEEDQSETTTDDVSSQATEAERGDNMITDTLQGEFSCKVRNIWKDAIEDILKKLEAWFTRYIILKNWE